MMARKKPIQSKLSSNISTAMADRAVCGKCSAKIQGRQQFIYCSGPCQGSYHCKCVNVGPVEYEILMKKGSSAYKCSDCTRRGAEDGRPIAPHRGGDSTDSNEATGKASESDQFSKEDNLQTTDDLIRQLLRKVDVLTSEVCYLKIECQALRQQVGVSFVRSNASDGASCASETVPAYAAVVKENQHTGASAKVTASERQHRRDVDRNNWTSQRDSATVRNAKASAEDDDGFTKVVRRRKPMMKTGVAKDSAITAVPGHPRTKSLFVSRLAPNTSETDVVAIVASVLDDKEVICTKLKPRHPSYSSFHLSVADDMFERVNATELWPNGSIFRQFFGRLLPSMRFGLSDENERSKENE